MGERLQGTHGPNKAPASSRGHAGDTHGTRTPAPSTVTVPAHPLPPRAESRLPNSGGDTFIAFEGSRAWQGDRCPTGGWQRGCWSHLQGNRTFLPLRAAPQDSAGTPVLPGREGRGWKRSLVGGGGERGACVPGLHLHQPGDRVPGTALPSRTPHHSCRGPRAHPSSHRHVATAQRGQPCQPSIPPWEAVLNSPLPSCPSSGWSAHPASCPASSGAGPAWLGPGTGPWYHCQRRGLLPG